MGDFFEQYKEQQKINENWFGKVFNKKPQQQPVGPQVTSNGNKVSITFENGSIAHEVNTIAILPYIKSYDWANSELSFLNMRGVKFEASYLNLDLNKEVVNSFKGIWERGQFSGVRFEGVFKGSSFHGNFFGPNSNYQGDIASFLDGSFHDTTQSGILGKPDMITKPAAKTEDTNIAFMPVGYYLQFRSKNGIHGYIKTIKRLDGINSDFRYEILDGFKGQVKPTIVDFPWTKIKQIWNDLFFDPSETNRVTGLIQVPKGDLIEEVYISSAPATFKTPVTNAKLEYSQNTKYPFNLSKIKVLGINVLRKKNGQAAKAQVELKFSSEEYFKKFEEVSNNIYSGVFQQDIETIKNAIEHGVIDGFGSFPYLRFVFNDIQGHNMVTPKPQAQTPKRTYNRVVKEANGVLDKAKFTLPMTGHYEQPVNNSTEYTPQDSMKRLSDFAQYFVSNIVNDIGEPDKDMQKTIIDKLKEALNVSAIRKAQKPAPSGPISPGYYGGKVTSESLHKEVRKIIRENL